VEIQLSRIKGYKFFYDYIIKEDCDGCGQTQNVLLEEVQVVEVGILRKRQAEQGYGKGTLI
jgi:hypothetical protein